MKHIIYRSDKSIIKRDGSECIKYYTRDTGHKKIRKECTISECLGKAGVDVIPLTLHNDYISSPYMKHGDLLKSLSRYDNDQLDYIFKKLVLIVDTMHTVGVAHRDIKLENILIDDDYNIHLIDFGECEVFKLQWETNEHVCNDIKGTLPYMAPEEFTRKYGFSPRKLDIWSLGIVYIAMTTKSYPWRSAKAYDADFASFLIRKTMFSSLPNIFKGVLETNPDKRITTRDIIDDEWFKNIKEVSLKFASF